MKKWIVVVVCLALSITACSSNIDWERVINEFNRGFEQGLAEQEKRNNEQRLRQLEYQQQYDQQRIQQ